MEKFIVTENRKLMKGKFLHQIQALRSFGEIKEGDLGGWVERESNLSQDGLAWIYGDACVFEDATVSEDARVFESAHVFGKAQVFGRASINGRAQVSGESKIFGESHIFNDAKVYGNASVSDHASVYMNAEVFGNAEISQKAEIAGRTKICGTVHISGEARVNGESVIESDDQILWFPKFMNRNKDTLTAYRTEKGQIEVITRYYEGILSDDFLKFVQREDENAAIGAEHLIEFIKIRLSDFSENKKIDFFPKIFKNRVFWGSKEDKK